MAKLLVHESSGVREFEMLDAEVHIGRELDNTLRLPDPSISRHHCVLRKVGNGYEIQDLQSSNGVLLNGSRVQSSPLRDGDRITLGQIQMTYSSPADEQGATVAIQIPVPSNPLGTVRMSPEQMAAIHAGGTPAEPAAPEKQPTGPNPVVPTEAAPIALAPVPPAPAPMPPVPMPAPPLPSAAPAPIAPSANDPGTAPGFGHFTNHGTSGGPSPVPEFLQGFLPSVPDTAIPTGERGDFLTRLLAILIDGVIGMVVYMVVMLIPVLGCFLAPFLGIAMLVFHGWCLMTTHATIGKKVMKLRVVSDANPAAPLEISQVVLRFVGYWVNGMLLGLPYLMILGSERRSLPCLFSKTTVIKVDR